MVRLQETRAVSPDEQFMQGNLDEKVSDSIAWELMLQAGPVGEQPVVPSVVSRCPELKQANTQ